MGVNAYRTSHNSPTPELLEACDRLGMLVMDENRLLGSDALHLTWFEEQIRRDRNHPSVAIWSLANEEFTTQGTPAAVGRGDDAGAGQAARSDAAGDLQRPGGNEFPGINEVIEVRGWSYHIGKDNMDAYTRPSAAAECRQRTGQHRWHARHLCGRQGARLCFCLR